MNPYQVFEDVAAFFLDPIINRCPKLEEKLYRMAFDHANEYADKHPLQEEDEV